MMIKIVTILIIIVALRETFPFRGVKLSKKTVAARLSPRDIIFDDKLPLEVRQTFYDIEKTKYKAEMEKDKAEETTRAIKAEKAALEFSNALEKLVADNSLLAPRAFVEFVETSVMAAFPNLINNTMPRESKWEAFLKNTPVGADILFYLSKEIPLWEKDAQKVAQRVKGIYSYSHLIIIIKIFGD